MVSPTAFTMKMYPSAVWTNAVEPAVGVPTGSTIKAVTVVVVLVTGLLTDWPTVEVLSGFGAAPAANSAADAPVIASETSVARRRHRQTRLWSGRRGILRVAAMK